MICKWCAKCADARVRGWNHDNWAAPYSWTVGENGEVCPGGTHCDCQHKEPGTAINREMSDAGNQSESH